MRENRYFVVPVDILTPFAHAPFSWPHDTLPCVLILLPSFEIQNKPCNSVSSK